MSFIWILNDIEKYYNILIDNLYDLKYIINLNNILILKLSLFIFSFAGLPPFAIFFIKYLVLENNINDLILLMLIIIYTFIALISYIKLVNYFYYNCNNNNKIPYFLSNKLLIYIFLSIIFTNFLVFF